MDTLPGIAEVVRALRASRPDGAELAESTARELLAELARYVRLVAANPTRKLSPSPLVDAAWHILLLNPKCYYRACEQARWPHAASVAGIDVLIDHSLAGALDADAVRRARYVSAAQARPGLRYGGAAASCAAKRRAAASCAAKRRVGSAWDRGRRSISRSLAPIHISRARTPGDDAVAVRGDVPVCSTRGVVADGLRAGGRG